ncbi:MAG: HAMP domain-containing histidine kinase, partial [Blastocatellia bacterium]|nr:HAMP domain-containing histidine kinase [Blastocatellia bacterium]
EVSEGERELMKSNLQSNIAQFCREFDREVKNAYLNFQAPETDLELAARYRSWLTGSAHPRLVDEIYQTQIDESGSWRLQRFNRSGGPAGGLFEPCPWPEKLEQIREKLARERTVRDSARVLMKNMLGSPVDNNNKGEKALIRISLGPIDSSIPGLIMPIMAPPSHPNSLALPEKYRIVVLNLDCIKTELFPALERKYFFGEGVPEYDIRVVNRDEPQKIIYRSGEGKDFSVVGDASGNLFSIQLADGDRNIFAGSHETGETNKRFMLSIVQNNVFFKQGDLKKGGRGRTLNSIFNFSGEGHWQLAVKHRSGSLEAAVARGRRKNLAISFGILLLLGASVGLIVLSSRRAQKLALQQMEFVAGVSHEFRTPLAVICSAAENLADGVIDSDEQLKRYGVLIRDEGRRLAEMVEQVLEFAGTQAQRRVYELQPVDLHCVIDDALAASRMQLAEGGFEIERKVPAAIPPVNADAAALSRALQNLLSNAMKYSGASRWLGLSVELAKTAQGEEAQIKVADCGIGVPPSELPRIFEPFYRGREVVAAQIHGNGLGLSLVKHIIEAHGGRISVASNENKMKRGTTFTLHLPIPVVVEEAALAPEDYENFAH